MGILQKLKSALGMDSSDRTRRRTEPDVTVEREPSTESEHAVKTAVEDDTADDEDPAQSAGEADSSESAEAEEPEQSAADEATSEDDSAEADADESGTPDTSPPVDQITGIGATYADRLEAAGIATVADLADSDVSTIVEAAQTNESRARDWLEQARDR